MDLALNNLHILICHKTEPTKQPTGIWKVIYKTVRGRESYIVNALITTTHNDTSDIFTFAE